MLSRLRPAVHQRLPGAGGGREPTAAEVAEHVGPLGRLMAAEGLQAKLTGTGNNKTRRYTFELKEKIEALLDSGEVE